MIELNHDNYYGWANTAISNSKVSDFLKSKEYYYRKHIAHELSPELTIPMKIGVMVDAMVTGSPIPFAIKCLKKENEEEFARQKELDFSQLVTPEQFEEAKGRATAITREPFYEEYLKKGTEFQVILQGKVRWGVNKQQIIPICGMLDAVTVTRDYIFIDDFKSVSPMKLRTISSWYWACHEMGYFRQLAVYKELYRQNHVRQRKKIICRHVVVTKVQEGLYKVALFIVPDHLLVQPLKEFMEVAKAIHKEKKWKDLPVTWEFANILKDPGGDIIYENDSEQ